MTTVDRLNKYLDESSDRLLMGSFTMKNNCPRIRCIDGFTVSVQASENHYCSPRENDGPWYSVEVGFPSEDVDSWEEYRTDNTSPVYAYVPIELVAEVIEEHGGSKQLGIEVTANG